MSTGMAVEYLDHMGTDLDVVNAARVSFAAASKWETSEDKAPWEGAKVQFGPGGVQSGQPRWLSKADANLIGFLARGMTRKDWQDHLHLIATLEPDEIERLLLALRAMPTHWAPFAHCMVKFRITAPVIVARQAVKHQIGFAWSEVSRRYVDDRPEFYKPKGWRKRAANVKQGSASELTSYPFIVLSDGVGGTMQVPYETVRDALADAYERAVDPEGAFQVAPELARMTLTQDMLTSWVWTGSLFAWARLAQARLDSHAQEEIRLGLARPISEVMLRLFPVSWPALVYQATDQ